MDGMGMRLADVLVGPAGEIKFPFWGGGWEERIRAFFPPLFSAARNRMASKRGREKLENPPDNRERWVEWGITFFIRSLSPSLVFPQAPSPLLDRGGRGGGLPRR